MLICEDMMRKYKVGRWTDKIEIVEITKETDQSVWIGTRRHSKVTEYGTYFDDFESAKQKLIDRFERQIKNAREMIHKAESALGTLRKMQE
jgi:uncharacterized membrane-anchored protein